MDGTLLLAIIVLVYKGYLYMGFCFGFSQLHEAVSDLGF